MVHCYVNIDKQFAWQGQITLGPGKQNIWLAFGLLVYG